jgi:hypothetical protein
LLSFLQKHVTRRSNVHISEIAGEWSTHQINLAILKKPIVLEFGAGRHLAQNIYLSQFFGLQTVVDLFAMLDLVAIDTNHPQVDGTMTDRKVEAILKSYGYDAVSEAKPLMTTWARPKAV